ncbi:MAG: Rdx family protein [Planctomycetes bacterium]|nr:Rdx family protein [Planctomycetota bacterium]
MSEFGKKFENITLVPSEGGRFEVSFDGQLVFDRKKEGRFPENEEIKAMVRKKV